MKSICAVLAGMTIALVATPVQAEYRTVLIELKQSDQQVSVTIHSDDKRDRRSEATVNEAVMAITGMQGWGSSMGVYVTHDGSVSPDGRNRVLSAILGNAWLDLHYYGKQAPPEVAQHFSQPNR